MVFNRIMNKKDMMLMKSRFSLFGVIALFVVASCQRTGEDLVPAPGFDPETNTVKTQFVMNVSTNTGKDTKTTAQFAQVGSNFLGMDAVHILTYALPYSDPQRGAFFYKPYYTNPDTKEVEPVSCQRDFNLGMLFSANSVTDENASRSVELAIPLGTNAVVLYGKALKSYSDDLQGIADAAGDPADLTTLGFTLRSRLKNMDAYEVGAFFFTRLLTYIISAGAVNQGSFWNYTPISTEDWSYHFWWPTPSTAVETSLPDSPADGTSAKGSDGITYKYYAGELAWKHLGIMYKYEYDNDSKTLSDEVVTTKNGTKMGISPLGEVLGEAYEALVNIKTQKDLHEIRAGSASGMLRTFQDMYAIIDRAADAGPTTWEEAAAKQMAKAVKARMNQFFEMRADGSIDFFKKSDGSVDVAKLITAISSATSTEDWNANKDNVTKLLDEKYFSTSTSEGFPINVGLPAGAAALTCEIAPFNPGEKLSLDLFSYTKDIPAYGMGDVTFPITNYRYPPELMYFGNSPIRVSSAEKTAQSYPSSVTLWDNEANWGGWESYAAVKSNTRSVAMVDNINYGTALLASTVTFGATVLKDNNKALHPGEEDQSIPTTYADEKKGFFVTGIVVGGQADVMGWDFVRKPTNTDFSQVSVDANGKFSGLSFEGNEFNKMVYDKVTTSYKVGTDTDPIYTLVWDNYDHTKAIDKQSDVYIGVELVNNTDMDIWGELNLIRKGGTFYLVGRLDLEAAVTAARASDKDKFTDLSRKYYQYPPFNPANGATINAPRVFMQDYMTKANLIIKEDALKHAYVTVPDLRSSQVSLGVSIDMEWESGLAFDVELGKLDD